MSEKPRGRSRHVELDLDQLVELQPGLGRLMPEIGRRYWVLFYAAQGGNWSLASYQLRQIAALFRIGATTRPKMENHLEAFRLKTLDGLSAALDARDWSAFDSAFRDGIESANRYHAVTGHPEIRWRLPDEPPADLDLGPVASG